MPESALTEISALPAAPRATGLAQGHARKPASSASLIPLFYAALFFLAGIAIARFLYMRPSFLLAGMLPLALVALFALAKAPRLVWIAIGCIWLALGVWSAEMEPAPAPNPAITQLSDGLLRTVEGTVTSAGPLRMRDAADDAAEDREYKAANREAGEQIQRVDLQIAAAEVVTDASDALLSMPENNGAKLRLSVLWPSSPKITIRCGQRLRAVIRMLPPETFHDSGVWSRAAYLEGQEIAASATIVAGRQDGNEPRLSALDTGSNPSIACMLDQARNAAGTHLQSLPELTHNLPSPLRATPEDAAMLAAMLTGDRSFLTRSLRAGFERTGSFHLIVVSGLHLAILAGCVFAIARRLRLGRWLATAITLAVSLAYALFTGFAVPIQRSFWMIALYLLGRLVYRDRSPLNVIGFAALCLAAKSPHSIFDASLQMTLLSVAAIAGIALPLLERTWQARIQAMRELRLVALDSRLPPEVAQFRVTLRLIAAHLEAAASRRIAWRIFPEAVRFALRLGEFFFLSFVVELALVLPMAVYFHRITVYALPINLIILPLMGILVPAAMLLLIALSLWPAAAILPASACRVILHLGLWLVRVFGAFHFGDLRTPEPALPAACVATLLFVLALQLARGSKLQRRLSLAALLLAALAALWPRPVDHPSGSLLVEAIDVGQGDSVLLIGPDGRTLLIDGGGIGLSFLNPGAQQPRSEFDVGEEVVSTVLWSRGIRRLDAVALTHAHHDHIGGLPAILRNFRPRELWVGNNPPVSSYTALLDEAASLGVRVRSLHAGDAMSLSEVHLQVLAPSEDYRPGPLPSNNDSLVLQARYKAVSVLLTGDAEGQEENSILAHAAATGETLQSTLLKVGHHGSLTSTHPAFLSAVAPAWAVISCGRRNRFGHPRGEILAELQDARVRTFRTDIDGASCFLLDGKSATPDPMCGQSRW